MQQPYVRQPPYGASLTQTVTPNYGTINPMASSAPAFMGAAVTGELLGTAADETNTAQYTPVTHPVEINTSAGSVYAAYEAAGAPVWPEGTLVMIEPADGNAEGADRDRVTIRINGTMGPNLGQVNGQYDQGVIRPLAADFFYEKRTGARKRDPVYATLAWSGVTTIKIPDGNPDLGVAAPCQNVFARMTRDGIQLRWTRARAGDQLLGRLVIGKKASDTLLSVCLDP